MHRLGSPASAIQSALKRLAARSGLEGLGLPGGAWAYQVGSADWQCQTATAREFNLRTVRFR